MGGYGSGKRFGKELTEDYRCIDIRSWQRAEKLIPGKNFRMQWKNGEEIDLLIIIVEMGQIRLVHDFHPSANDQPKVLDYRIELTTTTCHFGGLRYWFSCPAEGCGRRVAKLYSNGHFFACRHCYQLVFASQRENKAQRGIRGTRKIRNKLGWDPCLINPFSKKPKGMHWKTFARLMRKELGYLKDAYQGMMASLKKLDHLTEKFKEFLT